MRKLYLVCLGLVAQLLAISPALATVIPMTGATFSAGIDVNGNITDTAPLTSYTTAQGTVSILHGATSVASVTGGIDLNRNIWGIDGTEIDGGASVVGLDASTGSAQINVANFFFGQTVLGMPGEGNDFFLLDVGSQDPITVRPIDAFGAVIGNFSLSIAAASWGALAPSIDGLLNPAKDSPLGVGNPVVLPTYGLAFDLTDFTGTGSLSGVEGLQIDGLGQFDPLVVGFVPEPSTALLFAFGLTGLALAGRRGPRSASEPRSPARGRTRG